MSEEVAVDGEVASPPTEEPNSPVATETLTDPVVAEVDTIVSKDSSVISEDASDAAKDGVSVDAAIAEEDNGEPVEDWEKDVAEDDTVVSEDSSVVSKDASDAAKDGVSVDAAISGEDNGEPVEDWEKDLVGVLERGADLVAENGVSIEEILEDSGLSLEEWTKQLDSVLSEGVDYSSLRNLCLERTADIPVSRRLDVWKVSLGLSRKSDSMQSWNGSWDCLDRDAIEEQCIRQVEHLPDDFSEEERNAICLDMRSVLTVYSKSTGQRFRADSGWPELLLAVSSLRPSRKDAYNILYTVLQKYVPKNCRSNGKPFHLFRLLLLYHDVELCNFLDTRRVGADLYLQKWLRALFSVSCSLEVVRAMWDIYFLEADPFLVFFLALVMLMNAKEMLMDGTQMTKSDLADSISLFPSELGRDDLQDFCLLAKHYASLTPQSFRMDYHASLFGPMKNSPQASALPHALCLPIGLTELLGSLRRRSAEIFGGAVQTSGLSDDTAVNYFLVDCRPLEQYQRGRLLFSHHLDAELMLRDVTAFQGRVNDLQEVHASLNDGEDHWCFIGSGREEEDQYMHMAIAHVLQRNINYVSVARGGYALLRAQLWDRSKDLLDCQGEGEPEVSTFNAAARGSSSGDALPAGAGDRLNRPSREELREVKATAVKKMGELAGRLRGAVQEKKVAVRQRADNMQKRFAESRKMERRQSVDGFVTMVSPAFSIAGEDDTDEDMSVTLASLLAQGLTPDVEVSVFTSLREVLSTFKCSELKEDGYMVAGLLVLTADTLYGLRDLASRPGWAEVYHQLPLSNLVKITSKKKHPDLLTFHVGTVDTVHLSVRYIVPRAKAACAALKNAILAEMENNTPISSRKSPG